MFKLNLIHDPSVPVVTNVEPQGPLSTRAHQETARQVAEESIVLLKNQNLLPLDSARIKTIAIIGANADAKFANGGGSARIKAPYEITALQGISNRLGGSVKLIYSPGLQSAHWFGTRGLQAGCRSREPSPGLLQSARRGGGRRQIG